VIGVPLRRSKPRVTLFGHPTQEFALVAWLVHISVTRERRVPVILRVMAAGGSRIAGAVDPAEIHQRGTIDVPHVDGRRRSDRVQAAPGASSGEDALALMSVLKGSGVVVHQSRVQIDAIDAYSRHLVETMSASGIETRYLPNGLAPLLKDPAEPSWILLQYNPYSYGRSGFAPGLVRDLRRVRSRSQAPLLLMVHEAWLDMTDAKSSLVGSWQRSQLWALLRLADGVMTSTEALARRIGGGTVHVPVAANITPISTSPRAARERLGLNGKLAVALFGRGHPSRALDHAEAAIAAIADAHGGDQLIVLNLGAGAPPLRLPHGVAVRHPGRLRADELSFHLWASDLVLLPFSDGVSTRRGTLMAALAHGRPVLGLRGCNTDAVLADAADALALTPAGDPHAFSSAAVELTRDPERLRTIGDAGRRLYESRFDWPILAQSIASVLAATTPNESAVQSPLSRAAPGARTRRPARAGTRAYTFGNHAEVVFVAHDVGGAGGMERQSEQLVSRVLEAGHPVTVIARTCALGERKGLRFMRVGTPRRPFILAYPAFFAVASVLVGRRREALVHATGAIVANRVDVCTVHYCHRAAAAHVMGSRASRPGPLYRLHDRACRILSRAAEAWCYRPTCARLLCAVSGGVATELRNGFPTMARAVRTVPNGVDSAVFRPDSALRARVRAELGFDERAQLALFVGGDWERKGLAYAVDALALAPDWHLVVAGSGDPAPHTERSRAAGTESRVRFLGPVHEMPRLYAAADAFVLPSAYETFSLVTFEAAAAGLPLLVTRVSGVEDLLLEGVNGWFVARDARDIARRLNELRAAPELAHSMAAAARSAAAAYSWEAMADGYLAVYAELASETLSC
jgi:UDP-glucose:(heptosyl)LPS alpha-1,3-glucosyltransferase